ncbi:MAG TPA: hypothetical protein VKT77_23350 [Chthonomonadaceae bacterium]|nr:hypothetical protein [Chthonomonadaceae bacterium]
MGRDAAAYALNQDVTESPLLAGQMALPGLYRNIETGRCIRLERTDMLPPSFDGRVAAYVPVASAWRERFEADYAPEHVPNQRG